MKLSKILKNVDCKVLGNKNRKILHLSNIAQECGKNSIFFCLDGKNSSGGEWIETAIRNGCRVIVCKQSCGVKNITQIIVKDTRIAMSQIASNFYDNPAKDLKIVGVTGTNGKTTTTNIIANILQSKYNVGLIGSNGVFYDNKSYQTGFTTPDPILLYQTLADMKNSGIEYVVMEYSAHAIYLQKLWGIETDIVAFTNFSQDHLDYFETMDNYFEAKAQIFSQGAYKHSVVCIDDQYGKKIAKLSHNKITCSTVDKTAQIFIEKVEHTNSSQSFVIIENNHKTTIKTWLLGSFNLQNLLVAIGVCRLCGLSIEQIAKEIEKIHAISGRFECYSNGKNTIIIDYAHTPNGLENALKTANELAGKNRVLCVFGCGGNRDQSKRAQMAKISQNLADFSIITTDNPRFESNWDIAMDICSGFTKNKYQVVLDRGQALREALNLCRDGDVILLAGKGAETTTEINGTKVYASDKELVKTVLNL